MKSKKDYLHAIETVRAVVARLRPDQMELPTPDTKWQVRKLLQHMLYELSWTPDIVMGETLAVVGDRYEGDLLGSNPIAAWRSAAAQATGAVRRCDLQTMANLSYGQKPVYEYLQEAGTDQLVHAWDLGQAIDVAVEFDEALAEAMYLRLDTRRAELQASGLFGKPRKVATNAGWQTKLLALLGRSENWR